MARFLFLIGLCIPHLVMAQIDSCALEVIYSYGLSPSFKQSGKLVFCDDKVRVHYEVLQENVVPSKIKLNRYQNILMKLKSDLAKKPSDSSCSSVGYIDFKINGQRESYPLCESKKSKMVINQLEEMSMQLMKMKQRNE